MNGCRSGRGARRVGLAFAAAILLGGAPFVQAQSPSQKPGWSFVPVLNIAGAYDDNVLGEVFPETDELVRVKGELRVSYRGRRELELSSTLAVEGESYRQHTELNRVAARQEGGLNLNRALGPATKLQLGVRYNQSYDVRDIVPETGLELSRRHARSIGTQVGFTRRVGSSNTFGLRYVTNFVGLVGERLDVAQDVEGSWERRLGARTKLFLHGGPRFGVEAVTPVGEIGITHRFRNVEVEAAYGYARTIVPGAGEVDTEGVTGILTYERRRVAVRLQGLLTRTGRSDSLLTTFSSGVTFGYTLSSWAVAGASYRYARQHGLFVFPGGQTLSDVDRSRIILGVALGRIGQVH